MLPTVHRATVIISDTHLGRRRGAAVTARSLRPLWREADHLVINGDAADVHHRTHALDARCELDRLVNLCQRDGVKLTLLAGNHDPLISPARHLTLHDDRILVMHGDAMHPAVAPLSPNAPISRSPPRRNSSARCCACRWRRRNCSTTGARRRG
jgi:UDP-2,3-diacylglucosamine pyrophosphatase LpxH